MKLIKASTPYQGLQGECLTDTTKWGTNQRSILAFAKQTDHSCWALQERLPKDRTNHLLTWRHKDRRSGEAQCTVCRHISTAEPGRGGWELRCCICVRRRETLTQEPSTQMLTTRASGSRVQVQTSTPLLGRHLADMRKLKRNPFPPVRAGHPRAGDSAAPAEGTRKTKCPKETLLHSLFPYIQPADWETKPASTLTIQQYLAVQFKC